MCAHMAGDWVGVCVCAHIARRNSIGPGHVNAGRRRRRCRRHSGCCRRCSHEIRVQFLLVFAHTRYYVDRCGRRRQHQHHHHHQRAAISMPCHLFLILVRVFVRPSVRPSVRPAILLCCGCSLVSRLCRSTTAACWHAGRGVNAPCNTDPQ